MDARYKQAGERASKREGKALFGRRRVRWALAALAAGACFSGFRAQAQAIKDLTLEQLGSIEVTSQTKEPEQIWRTAAATSVLTPEDIRRLGATTIPELLRLLPGVFVGTVNSNQWAVGVRGFTSNFSKSLLVLIDGRSVYTPLFGGVYWQVQDTVLEDIERIEVIRGPGGTVWGENAVNGVINIITKSSKDTPGLLATVNSGNLERLNGELRYGGTMSPKITFRVFGKGLLRGPEIHPDGDPYDAWHLARGGFRADWKAGPRDAVMVQGDLYHGNNPRRVALQDTDDPVSGGDVLARWSHTRGIDSNFFVQGYIDRTVREGIAGGLRSTTFDIDAVLKQRLNGRVAVLVGAGYRNNPTSFTQHQAAVDLVPHRQNPLLYSTFAQGELALVPDRLLFTLGLKAEHNLFTGWDLQPSGRLLYRATEHQTYWGSITRAVRSPSQLEENLRYVSTIANPSIEVLFNGNKNFEAETLMGYEAGYRHLVRPNVYLDVAGFYNQYDHLQGFLPGRFDTDPVTSAPSFTTLYGNTVKGSTRGVEFAPDWKVNPHWRLNGSYSLLRYNLRSRDGFSDPAAVAGYAGSTPLHMFSVQSRIDLAHGFELDGTLRRAGSLPAQKVAAYTTAGLRLGWRHHGFDVSVAGRDLLDAGHSEFGSGDGAVPTLGIRRSVFGKVVWTPRQ